MRTGEVCCCQKTVVIDARHLADARVETPQLKRGHSGFASDIAESLLHPCAAESLFNPQRCESCVILDQFVI